MTYHKIFLKNLTKFQKNIFGKKKKYKNQKNIKTKKIKKNQKISKEKIIFYMIYQKIFF